jgi:hypothetical protein
LFSKPSVAEFINASFEPVWISVRPVPIVHIDFGDGRVLTRTLHGNILTSVCTADGLLLDSLPGIYTEAAYRDRLDQLRLLARNVDPKAPDKGAAYVLGYHERAAIALAKGETPERFQEKKRVVAITKSLVELPVEQVVSGPRPVTKVAGPPSPAAAAEAKPNEGDVAGWKALVEDTELNEKTRRRQIHEMLAKVSLVKPEKVLKPIYKDVLHADLDDPYLGLGKDLFGSYPFAEEDKATVGAAP